MSRTSQTDTTERERSRVENYVTSRRKMLAGTAGIGATLLAGCSSGDDDMGATEEPTMEPTAEPTDEPTEESEPIHPDVAVLNYALTLEHLEYAFYREGVETYGDEQVMNADVLEGCSDQVRMTVPDRLRTLRDHEKAHVDAIVATVEDLGGTPVTEGEYQFDHSNPSEFLALGQALENTGVAAYKGAAPDVANNDVLGAALTIHSVESRHASLLNYLNDTEPFPAAFGEAKSMDEVTEIAGQFITDPGEGGNPDRETADVSVDRKQEDDTSDVDVLNYALTLEHLEHAFYRDGVETYSDQELMDAEALSEFSERVRTTVPDRLRTLRDHEKAHVDAIVATIEDLGGDPVEEATYDFGYENPSELLAVAKALENTGVAAYAGAAPTVQNDDIFGAAAAIHDVEARHASFLNELNMENPFPAAFDEAKTMDEVVEIAGQFIVE